MWTRACSALRPGAGGSNSHQCHPWSAIPTSNSAGVAPGRSTGGAKTSPFIGPVSKASRITAAPPRHPPPPGTPRTAPPPGHSACTKPPGDPDRTRQPRHRRRPPARRGAAGRRRGSPPPAGRGEPARWVGWDPARHQGHPVGRPERAQSHRTGAAAPETPGTLGRSAPWAGAHAGGAPSASRAHTGPAASPAADPPPAHATCSRTGTTPTAHSPWHPIQDPRPAPPGSGPAGRWERLGGAQPAADRRLPGATAGQRLT